MPEQRPLPPTQSRPLFERLASNHLIPTLFQTGYIQQHSIRRHSQRSLFKLHYQNSLKLSFPRVHSWDLLIQPYQHRQLTLSQPHNIPIQLVHQPDPPLRARCHSYLLPRSRRRRLRRAHSAFARFQFRSLSPQAAPAPYFAWPPRPRCPRRPVHSALSHLRIHPES